MSVEDVKHWLQSTSLQPFAARFEAASITGGQLAAISRDQDLKDLGLTLQGQRDTFRQLLAKLQAVALAVLLCLPLPLLRPHHQVKARPRPAQSSTP